MPAEANQAAVSKVPSMPQPVSRGSSVSEDAKAKAAAEAQQHAEAEDKQMQSKLADLEAKALNVEDDVAKKQAKEKASKGTEKVSPAAKKAAAASTPAAASSSKAK